MTQFFMRPSAITLIYLERIFTNSNHGRIEDISTLKQFKDLNAFKHLLNLILKNISEKRIGN